MTSSSPSSVSVNTYGDSMSDVFLFREVGVRIAVNADRHLADLADVAIDGTDLLPAYRAARRLSTPSRASRWGETPGFPCPVQHSA
jgi:hypothetical protein